MIRYLVYDHFRLALHAGLLFAVGLFTSWPVIRYKLWSVAWLPRQIVRFIQFLMGPHPSILRMGAIIFAFNSTVMFLQMASGFHPFVPKLFGIWTGMNVAIMAAMAGSNERLLEMGRARSDQWLPPEGLTVFCGVLVLVLELPCYWYSLAMGMSLGHSVQGSSQEYLSGLAPRATAYVALIIPALLVSAFAEAIAVRSSSSRMSGADES